MKFRKKKKDSLVSVDDLLKCLLQFKCPHRSPGQDVGICQGWGRRSLCRSGNSGTPVMRTGYWKPSPVCEDQLSSKRTFAEWAGRKRGSNTELGGRTVFEYKRCLPHRVWGWLSRGALIMNSSPFLRLQGWGPVLLSAPCALYKYSQLFSKSALSGDSE